MGQERKLKAIAWITTALLILFSIIGTGPTTYKLSVIFLAPMLWAVYWQREKIALEPVGYSIFALAILLHDLGAFGFYRREFFGLEFDLYVHAYFGFAGAFVLARALEQRFGWQKWGLLIGTVLFIMGMGAIHELIEYASTLALGPEKGMLKINDPDKFDTQKDLLNNLCGAIAAVALYQFLHKKKAPAHRNRAEAVAYRTRRAHQDHAQPR